MGQGRSAGRWGRMASLLTTTVVVAACGGTGAGSDIPRLSGPYLGQTPPGERPEIFAPGIVSTGMYTRDIAMTPDGSEIYFGVLLGRFTTIVETHLEGGRWTRPEVAPFARDAQFFNLEPHIAPDGQRFFFLSTRVPPDRTPEPDEIRAWKNQDIWVMDREGERWGEPYNLGPPVNTELSEFFPSTTRDGTLYFTRSSVDGRESLIYRARRMGEGYAEPEVLGPEVNAGPMQYNAFIDPDERYLILCAPGRADSRGGTDYYVVFRDQEDRWSEPVNLGDEVNTAADAEFSPYVSPDGRYFFFMSTRRRPDASLPDSLSMDFLRRFRTEPEGGNPAIYWMDASFIEELRPAEAGEGGDEDGVIAFYSDRDGDPEIYVMAADGTGQRRVTRHPGWDVGPSLSPDRRHIAFLSSRDDVGGEPPEFAWEIYVVNVDGTDLQRLTRTPGGEDHVAWSPDGSRISYNVDSDGDGFQEIWVMGADGSGARRISQGDYNDQWASWSPDGMRLVYASDREGGLDLWMMDADGGAQTRLTRDPRPEIFPEWGPADDLVAYMVLENGPTLWTVELDGANARQRSEGRGEDPAWAPDGSALLFQDWKDRRMEIFRLDLATGAILNLSDNPANDLWPSWR